MNKDEIRNSIVIGKARTGKTQDYIIPTIKYVCTDKKEDIVVISPKDDIKCCCADKLREYGYCKIEVTAEEAQSQHFFLDFYNRIPTPRAVFISDIELIKPTVADSILGNLISSLKLVKHGHIRLFIDEVNSIAKINLSELLENSKNNDYSVMAATQSVSLLNDGKYKAEKLLDKFETVIFTDDEEKRRYNRLANA